MKWIRSVSLLLAVLFICALYTPCVHAGTNNEPVWDSGLPKANPSAVVLTRFDEQERTDVVAFALGSSQEELADWFADCYGGFTGYDAQGNPYDLITGTWSLKNVDTGIPGVYYASATPNLGDDYILGNGVTLPRQLCAVSIQVPGKPDINCCVSARGFLRFPWVLSSAQQNDLEQFTVCLRKDGGAWTQLNEGFFFTSGDLQFSQRIFQRNSSYDLQVFYPGGQTGILSFQYDNELLIVDYAEGDRDGGDVKGDNPSSGTQPAPTPSPKPNHSHDDNDDDKPIEGTTSAKTVPGLSSEPTQTPSEPMPTVPTVLPNPEHETSTPETKPDHSKLATQNQGVSQNQAGTNLLNHSQTHANTQTKKSSVPNTASTVQELYSPTQTVISGLRLRDLCVGEKSVVFGEGDLTVSIPSKQLLALKLGDLDTLSVKLMQPKKNQITLAVEAGGSAITELPGTILRLRYTPQLVNAGITIWNEAEKKAADAEFDGEFLRFSVDTAGTYTISEAAAVSKESKASQGGVSSHPLLMGGGLLLAGGGIALVRRKCYG